MVSMLDELKEGKIWKLILIVRFACATLDVGHPIQVLGRTWTRTRLGGTVRTHRGRFGGSRRIKGDPGPGKRSNWKQPQMPQKVVEQPEASLLKHQAVLKMKRAAP
jgi:hypothetical protein